MASHASTWMWVILSMPLCAEVRDLKAFYQQRCAVCHGPDGSGRGPDGARLGGRNLLDSRWLARQQDLALVESILNGQGPMPGFRRQLSEGEARRLVKELIRPMARRKGPRSPLRNPKRPA